MRVEVGGTQAWVCASEGHRLKHTCTGPVALRRVRRGRWPRFWARRGWAHGRLRGGWSWTGVQSGRLLLRPRPPHGGVAEHGAEQSARVLLVVLLWGGWKGRWVGPRRGGGWRLRSRGARMGWASWRLRGGRSWGGGGGGGQTGRLLLRPRPLNNDAPKQRRQQIARVLLVLLLWGGWKGRRVGPRREGGS